MNPAAPALTHRLWDAARILLVCAAIAFVVIWSDHRLFSASDDLSFHYRLADHLSRTWRWPALSEPPLAYDFASIIGKARGSTLTGLNVVACACVFGSYLLLLGAFAAACDSLLGAALAGAMLVYGFGQHAIIGADARWNFLYPQLVGQFFVLLIVLWLSRRRPGWAELAVSAAAAVLLGWIDGFALLAIAALLLWRQAAQCIRQGVATRRLELGPATRTGAAIVVLILLAGLGGRGAASEAVARTPLDLGSFSAMSRWLAVVLLGASGALIALRSPKGDDRGVEFLGAAGGAFALAALLQIPLAALGLGGGALSEQRWVYALVTLLALVLGAFAQTATRTSALWRIPRPVRVLAPPILAAAAVFCMSPPHAAPLHYVVKYQQAIRKALADSTLPADAFGGIISQNRIFPGNVNLAINEVDLKAGAAPARYAFMSPQPGPVPDRCIRGRLAFLDMILVSLPCQRDAALTLNPGQALDMAQLADRPPNLESGWGPKEPSGLWSDGDNAVILIHSDQVSDPILLSLGIDALLSPPAMAQHVHVAAAGHTLGSWTFDRGRPSGEIKVAVPRALAPDGRVRLDLSFPDVSPSQRKAVFLRTLSASLGRTAHPGYSLDLSTVQVKPDYFGEGWSAKEPSGVWSDGKKAALSLEVGNGHRDIELTLTGYAFIPAPAYVQHMVVSADGQAIGGWTFHGKTASGVLSVVIPKAVIHDGVANLTLAFPDATSPADHHLSADPRELAFFVQKVAVADATPHP